VQIERTTGGVSFPVRVIPRASRPGISGERDGALLVRVRAAPVEGAANGELLDVIAHALDVPRKRVTILSGEHARLKRVHVSGIDVLSATRLLS
jgi:uncharacterized protein YggU (UPF0235/DUF167 family)